MNVKALIPLVAGLCIGGFALKMGLDTLQQARAAKPEFVEILAAKEAIPRGTVVFEEMLQRMKFPKDLVPEGALLKVEEVVHRVPHVDLPAGLPLLNHNLLPPGEHPGLHVPDGYRAVAVKIDESSGVDFHLVPGCHVDVVGVFTAVRDGMRQKLARTVLENVQVAAVGPRISTVVREGDQQVSRPTRAVTLLVKPEKVQDLHLAEQQGRIKLSMRSDEDESQIENSRAVSLAELLDPNAGLPEEAAEPEPAPQPQPEPVVVHVPMPAAEEEVEEEDPQWVVSVYRGADEPQLVRFKNRNSAERVTAAEHQAQQQAQRRMSGPARFVPPPNMQQPPTAAPSAATPSAAAPPQAQVSVTPKAGGNSWFSSFLGLKPNNSRADNNTEPADAADDMEPQEASE